MMKAAKRVAASLHEHHEAVLRKAREHATVQVLHCCSLLFCSCVCVRAALPCTPDCLARPEEDDSRFRHDICPPSGHMRSPSSKKKRVQATLAFLEGRLTSLEIRKAPLEAGQEAKYRQFVALKQRREGLKDYITSYAPEVAAGPETGTEGAVELYNSVQRELAALSRDGQNLTRDPGYQTLLEVRAQACARFEASLLRCSAQWLVLLARSDTGSGMLFIACFVELDNAVLLLPPPSLRCCGPCNLACSNASSWRSLWRSFEASRSHVTRACSAPTRRFKRRRRPSPRTSLSFCPSSQTEAIRRRWTWRPLRNASAWQTRQSSTRPRRLPRLTSSSGPRLLRNRPAGARPLRLLRFRPRAFLGHVPRPLQSLALLRLEQVLASQMSSSGARPTHRRVRCSATARSELPVPQRSTAMQLLISVTRSASGCTGIPCLLHTCTLVT